MTTVIAPKAPKIVVPNSETTIVSINVIKIFIRLSKAIGMKSLIVFLLLLFDPYYFQISPLINFTKAIIKACLVKSTLEIS